MSYKAYKNFNVSKCYRIQVLQPKIMTSTKSLNMKDIHLNHHFQISKFYQIKFQKKSINFKNYNQSKICQIQALQLYGTSTKKNLQLWRPFKTLMNNTTDTWRMKSLYQAHRCKFIAISLQRSFDSLSNLSGGHLGFESILHSNNF